MRVTCLGSTRFVGPAAVAALERAGHRVTLIHRGAHPVAHPDAQRHVDRADATAFRRAVRDTRPDVVVDFRAMTRAQAAAAAASVEAPFVVLSSQDVYAQFGSLNGLPAPPPEPRITESSPLTVPYPFRDIGGHTGGPDYDKKDVEAVYRAAGGPVTVLRLPAVYGAGDPRRRFGGLLDALDEGATELPRAGGGRLRWTHAHVRDVATAITRTVEAPAEDYRCFNVGEAHVWTMSEWAERVARAAGHSFVWHEQDSVDDKWGLLGALPNDVVVDSSSFRSAIGAGVELSEAARLSDLVAGLRASRRSD